MTVAGRHEPARARPVVSYVVLTRNSARHIECCVRSLTRARSRVGADPGDEIWIVDNGSTDETVAIVETLRPQLADVDLTLIRLPENRGTTIPRNLALRQARGSYVAVVDSDVEIPAGTIDRLVETLERNRRCGLVAPRLVYPDGRAQLSADVFPTLPHKLRRALGLRAMERRLRVDFTAAPYPVDYTISALWLLRREVLDAVGLLDEQIFYAPEDVDYCVRVWKAGFTILYDPSVYAVHDAQEISRRLPVRRVVWQHIGGLAYFFWKHGYLFSRRRLYRSLPSRPVPPLMTEGRA